MDFRVFTWNMQRGRSMTAHHSYNQKAIHKMEARGNALTHLCDTSDIGFVQEAGQDLHGPIRTNAAAPFPSGRSAWRAAMRPDFQSDHNPCRSALFCKVGSMRVIHLDVLSGAWDHERFPVAAILTIGGFRILLCSFHATSGYKALANVRDFADRVDAMCEDPARRLDAVLVGGDFNCVFAGVSYSPRATHQNGTWLDGFYSYVPPGSRVKSITISNVRILDVPTRMELRADPSLFGRLGFYARARPHWGPTRVSDHVPVLADVSIV